MTVDTTDVLSADILTLDPPSPTIPPKPFPLLSLPHELILQILSYTCISPFPLHKASQPAITRTNRLLRHEGLKIFYPNNAFFTTNNSDLWVFLDRIGPKNASNIGSILVEWVASPWEPRWLKDRRWEHFACEMTFLLRARLPVELQDREVFVRVKDGRVLLGESRRGQPCYQISLREDLDEKEWTSAKTLAEENGAERMPGSRDFWVQDLEKSLDAEKS